MCPGHVATGVIEPVVANVLMGDKTVTFYVVAAISMTSTFGVVLCIGAGSKVLVSALDRDISDNCFPLLKFMHT